MAKEVPIDEALDLLKKGFTNEQISSKLEEEGYGIEEIADAINQASIKMNVEQGPEFQSEGEELEIPEPELEIPAQEVSEVEQGIVGAEQAAAGDAITSTEDIQKIVEQVIEEKWKDVMFTLGDLQVWKARLQDDLDATKQEVVRLSNRFDSLQAAVIGRVKGYEETISGMGADIRALEGVLGKILQPLSENVKELSKITERLKGAKR